MRENKTLKDTSKDKDSLKNNLIEEKVRIKKILNLLDKKYGKNIPCFLEYKKDYELLFATILSAQSTDARVNEVTKVLFDKYKNLDDYKNAKIQDVENIVRPCGFQKSKEKHIIDNAKIFIDEYGGIIPSDIEKLTKFHGVGRKTANVIRTHIFKIPSIVVDTHVLRTSKLLGFTNEKDPVKVEKELENLIPKNHWSNLNPQLMTLGRTYCNARKKDCENCFLNELCVYSKSMK